MGVGEKAFQASGRPLHRSADQTTGQQQRRMLGIGLRFQAKAPPYVRGHDTDFFGCDVENLIRQHLLNRLHTLRAGDQRVPIKTGVIVGQCCPRLHRGARQHRI